MTFRALEFGRFSIAIGFLGYDDVGIDGMKAVNFGRPPGAVVAQDTSALPAVGMTIGVRGTDDVGGSDAIGGVLRPLTLWLVCWLAWPHSLIAQRAIPGDWTRVRSLPLNASIVVKTKSNGTYHGDMIDITVNGLSLNSDERGFPGRASRRRDLRREDILKIRRFSRTGSAFAGAGLGAAAGIGIGLAINLSARSNEDRGLTTAVLGLFGTLLGWAVGRHSTLVKGETIYVAP